MHVRELVDVAALVAYNGPLLIDGARALAILSVPGEPGVRVALATSAGYLLVLDVADVPRLARGKGVKLIGIPPKAVKAGESLTAAVVLGAGDRLRIEAGQRHKSMDARELADCMRGRGKRGAKLPRGFQNVARLLAEPGDRGTLG